MRYFVRDNSWFDTHDYDIPLIKNTLKEAGATHIRTRNRWDWSNQPAVVTFRAEEWELDRITEYLQKAFQTEWIMLEPMWGKTKEVHLENTSNELCPQCDEEVKLPAWLGVFDCPNCKSPIVSCNMCEDMKCADCKLDKKAAELRKDYIKCLN